MPTPLLRTLARSTIVAAATAFASLASGQDIGSTIALPDAPFVLPVLSNYVFPADPRSADVLTQRNNNNRTGASYEPGVNAHTVRSFRKLAEIPFGGVISAQPLYVHSAIVHGQRTPALIVATSTNEVYAITPSGGPLWHASFGPATAATDNVTIGSVTTTPGADCDVAALAAWEEHPPPGGENGLVGIEGTPVVDLANGQVLVGYRSKGGLLHLGAIDLNSGDIRHDVVVPRDAVWHGLNRNRAGLLLADGVVYAGFSSLCELDNRSFHGSIAAFDAKTLANVGWFDVTPPNIDGGGVWQGATGIAADDRGDLYFATGNRRLGKDRESHDAPNLCNSILRVRVRKLDGQGRPVRPGEPYRLEMKLGDYFTPYRKVWQDWADMDLAASGVLLLPKTRYLVGGGKESILYVLDRANFGHFEHVDQWNAAFVENLPSPADIVRMHLLHDDPGHDRMHQKFVAGLNSYEHDPTFGNANTVVLNDWMTWPHIHGTPVFARFRADAQFLFVWPEKDRLKRFQWHGDRFDPRPLVSRAAAPPVPLSDSRIPGTHCPPNDPNAPPCFTTTGNGMPGGMLSVNIDGESGVVFASVPECRNDPNRPQFPCIEQRFGSLRAFDPFTLEEVWNNRGMGSSDDYWFAKFVPPTIANGWVFLPTASGKVIVYGP